MGEVVRASGFGEGNVAGVRHGAFMRPGRVPAVLERDALELHAQLVEEFPFIHEFDAGQVLRYCRLEAAARRLDDYWMAVWDGEAEVDPRRRGPRSGPEAALPFIDQATKTNLAAAKLAQDLGLDPTGRFKLLKDAGWARQLSGEQLGVLAARGREARALRPEG